MTKVLIDPAQNILTAKQAEVWNTASQIISDARREAEKIKGEAHKLVETEKQAGFKQGLEEARLGQTEEMLKTVESGIKYIEHVESSLVEIVATAVEKIIGDLGKKQAITAVVKEALGHMLGEEKVRVRVHPDCADHLKKFGDDLSSKVSNADFLEIVPDNRLEQTDCILENKLGVVNASIPLQLKNLRMAMQNALGKSLGGKNLGGKSLG